MGQLLRPFAGLGNFVARASEATPGAVETNRGHRVWLASPPDLASLLRATSTLPGANHFATQHEKAGGCLARRL